MEGRKKREVYEMKFCNEQEGIDGGSFVQKIFIVSWRNPELLGSRNHVFHEHETLAIDVTKHRPANNWRKNWPIRSATKVWKQPFERNKILFPKERRRIPKVELRKVSERRKRSI